MSEAAHDPYCAEERAFEPSEGFERRAEATAQEG